MTIHNPPPAGRPVADRGGAPVGQLAELPPVELTAIVFLRAWCEGGAARADIGQGFVQRLGPEKGAAAAWQFDALMKLVLANARRPLMRHGIECPCFGGDEAAFANLVATAIVGDRDEATLFASILLNGYAVFDAVRAAEALTDAFLALMRSPAPGGAFRH